MFLLIVISNATMLPGEAAIIQQLFANGLQLFHLRKPNADEQAVRQLIEAIPAEYRGRIVMHGFFHLMEEYGITRWHFREEHRMQTSEEELAQLKVKGYTLSTSVHDIATVQKLSLHFSYTFFSPVFDSISKKEYKRVIDDDFYLKDEQKAVPVIALGGINADNVSKLPAMNFDGAALLGSIWSEPANAVAHFKMINHAITTTIRSNNSRL